VGAVQMKDPTVVLVGFAILLALSSAVGLLHD
jgi:hypothetical protein